MNIEELIDVFQSNVNTHKEKDNEVIKYKSNVIYGKELGVVLEKSKTNIYYVFMHLKNNGIINSPVFLHEYDDMEKANLLYNDLENLISNSDVAGIVKCINEK